MLRAAMFAVVAVMAGSVPGQPVATRLTYQAPVAGAVIDPFRAPPTPYSAGHRGVQYGTGPDEAVHAAAAGQVVFAGAVAGVNVVVILHADRIRTTYSGLSSRPAIVVGAAVAAGQELGRVSGSLFFGARAGTAYLDPLVLLAHRRPRARLVPVSGG